MNDGIRRNVSAVALTLMLAACGGGGGVGSTPTPVPRPTPTPTPTPRPAPTPTPSPGDPFDTAEYRNSTGLTAVNILPAWRAGATGRGILAGIIDSGIDTGNPEFAGRISTRSVDTAGNGSIKDEGGHGTAVATVLAAAHDGRGVEGVAFDSTLLVLRTDAPGSCTAPATGGEDGCSHEDPAIARALDVATGAGARVVNISLGGSPPDVGLRAAIDRATAAGVVIVFSAGNDGKAEVDPFAAIATDAAVSRGLVLVAGATDGAGAIAGFSNRAGTARDVYVAAPGVDIPAYDQKGVLFLWSGTSFSAPHVAGAIALLAQAFPNMTGRQLVDLLLSTARDAGAPGVDPVYGHGLLDIGRAFQPQGATALAGSGTPVSLVGASGTLSSAMGDAAQGGHALQAVILDKYDRAFGVELAGAIRGATPQLRLAAALQSTGRTAATETRGGTMLALTIAPGRDGIAVERLLLSGSDADRARATAVSIATRLGVSTEARFAIAQGAGALVATMAGRRDPAFLIARDAAGDPGFERQAGSAFALRRRIGAFGLTVAAETGDALVYSRDGADAIRHRYRSHPYAAATVALDRRFGALSLSLAATRMIEDRTVLGALFDPVLGARAGRSWFVDADARLDLGDGWRVGAAFRRGWTGVAAAGPLVTGATIRTSAFAVDAGKVGLFDGDDALAFRVAQPLRVTNGGLDLTLPVAYDYGTGVTGYGRQHVNLAPHGREIDYELRYDRPLGRGRFGANLYLRTDPGNYAAVPDDIGVALRFVLGF